MAFINLLLQISAILLIINLELLMLTNITPGRSGTNKGAFTNIFDQSLINSEDFVQGTSWADYNNDGNEDLLVAGNHLKLYKNNGNGTFRLATDSGIRKNGTASSGLFGDYDNDGCRDLYLVSSSRIYSDQLFHNNCDGSFTNVTVKSGIDDQLLGKGASWADYNNDGYLDIYVANFSSPEQGGRVVHPNLFYRNNGNGTFTNIIDAAHVPGYSTCGVVSVWSKNTKIVNGPDKPSFQPVWFDYNNDGKIDLFVADDGNASPLYKNNGDGTFTEVTKEAGLCRLGTNMGIAVGDYNNDGFMDFYTTNVGPNFFWRNNGNGTFTDVASETKTADLNSIGWGTAFLDFDNDGYLDLYVTNGVSDPKPSNYGNKKQDKLFQNTKGGIFIEVSSQNNIEGNYPKYASAVSDFDNNGFPDILVMYRPDVNYENGQKIKLYKNNANKNNWLSIKLVGTKSNKDAIGAKISVKSGGITQTKEILSGSSFMSQNSLIQTFGLAKRQSADEITVKWPSGKTQIFKGIEANQKITIEE